MSAAAEQLQGYDGVPIAPVPPTYLPRVWPRAEPLLAKVVKPETGYSLDTLLTELQMMKHQLWVIGDFEAVAVTTIQERPLHRVLWVQFIAGSGMDHWLGDWITVQEEFAKAEDCIAVEFSGRRGWNKVYKRHDGYKPVLTTFRKEI